MQLFATSYSDVVVPSNFTLTSGQAAPCVVPQLQRDQTRFWKSDNVKLLISPENFMGFELSLVPEVESVFVDHSKEKRKEYRIVTVVNVRDPDVRAKVYEREQAIIDAYPNLDFDFRVIARMNRDLSEIIDNVGKLAYRR